MAAAALLVLTAAPVVAAEVGSSPEPSATVDDGTVEASVVVGSRLFVGGTFTSVDGSTHRGIAALDAASGALDPSFTASVAGTVTSLATDGTNVFVGGTFTSVNGASRTNVAGLAPDGSLLPLKPVPSRTVDALAFLDGVLYLGGKFGAVGSVTRPYLAGVDPVTGLVTDFDPQPNAPVRRLLAAPDGSLYVGGLFTTIGVPAADRNYVANLDPATGAVLQYDARLPYEARRSDRAAVLDIALRGDSVYLATGGHLPNGNSLYRTTAGVSASPLWQVQADGDVQAVEAVPGSPDIHAGGHFGYLCLPSTTTSSCPSDRLVRSKKSFVVDDATGAARPWVTFNSAHGVSDLQVAGDNLYAVGSFTAPTSRVARFPVTTDGTVSTVPTAPQALASTSGDGSVQLSWKAPADDGGAAVAGYTVYRDSAVGYVRLGSTGATSFVDRDVVNGTTYRYEVSATNAVGEGPRTGPVSATPTAGTTTVPAAPVLSGTATAGANSLSWTVPADGGSPITGYTVMRGGVAYADVGASTRSYADTGVTPGVTYTYQVAARNAVGTSVLSDPVRLTATGAVAFDGSVRTVTASAETIDRQPAGTNDADDPAIWVHPSDPAKSLVIGTIKVGGLDVYRTNGSLLQTISIPTSSRYNNVQVLYGITLGGATRDLAVVSDRGTDTLRVFAIDGGSSAPLTDVTAGGAPLVFGDRKKIRSKTVYGLTGWRNPASGQGEVFVTQENTTNLAKVVLRDAGGGKVTYARVASISLPESFTLPNGSTWTPCFNPKHPDWTAHVEGMVVDPATGTLWADQEIVGLWKMTTDLTSPVLVHKLTRFGQSYSTSSGRCRVDESSTSYGEPYLPGDLEGIALYGPPRGSAGYLIMSNQNESIFTVFGRDGASHIGTFDIGAGPFTDAVNVTDGVEVVNVPMGSAYPEGLLVTQDGKNAPEGGTNFKLTSWGSVADALGLVVDTGGDPRS